MTAEAGDTPILYSYWRSTAAYRVRIALGLKGIAWRHAGVDLVRGGGEQHQGAYRDLNPAGLVPTLVWGDVTLSQSLAICEYLDEVQPEPALLPPGPEARAQARAIALDIACDVHPLNNLRVQQYLGRELDADEGQRTAWMHHWMALGFGAVERRLQSLGSGDTCVGGAPGLADLCLVAQAYNADRFGFTLDGYPRVQAVLAHCRALRPFRQAVPEAQPDAPEDVRISVD
jgi:maleylacetoacetate isomerase